MSSNVLPIRAVVVALPGTGVSDSANQEMYFPGTVRG